MGWNVTLVRSRNGAVDSGGEIAQQIVTSHIRSLIGEHLLDVQSTDQHNVKPWFNGKIDYAPDVRDFATDGFPLIPEGRVDYIDHRPVCGVDIQAAEQHVINVFFVWPGGSSPSEIQEAVSGYNLTGWSHAGMNYSAISDLNAAELRQFVDLYTR